MNNKKKQIVLVISAFVLLAVIISLLLFNSKKTDFYETSELVYDNINSGFYHQAQQQFPDLYSQIFNKQTAMSFLKLLYKYSSALDEYTQLKNYSEKLYKRYSRTIEIAAIYSFALNKSGKFNKALETSAKHLARSIYNPIYLVSTLKTVSKINDKKIIEKIDKAYRLFFNGSEYTSASALEAANNLRDERLVYNAAIMLMREGKTSEALKQISLLSEDNFSEAKMYISYDNKDFTAAENYFIKLIDRNNVSESSLKIFGADIFLKNKKSSIAQSIYKDLISSDPDFSWIPYRNLYSLNRENVYGIRYLEEGLNYFDKQQHLILSAAWEIYLTDEREKLNNFLNNLDNKENNALSKLFRLNLEINNRNPEHIVGNFWTIYNLEPQSNNIFIAFSNYLLKNNFIDQLNLLIQKHERLNGQNLWTLTYSAIGLAISGNYSEAEKKINIALETYTNTNLYYNKAVILTLLNSYNKAVNMLEQAAIYENNYENNYDRLAKIYFKLSVTYYTIREYEKALHNIRKSLSIFPNDIRSNLMLKKIKEEYNDKT